jgi:hypothetical protein
VSLGPLGTGFAEVTANTTTEQPMGTIAELKIVGNEGPSTAYVNGVTDGQSARAEGSSLSLYLQVGIDDYAKGFRAGFFGQMNLSKDGESR